ncbi:MAG: LppX_LprAFG lipoprotein [Chloroflexota bacterium]|nr:LppX_LprAFG lipoprotein [Chloroflexota bacterium]
MTAATPARPRPRLSSLLPIVAVFALIVACGPSSEDDGATAQERLARAAERIQQVTSVDFTLSHDEGETPLLPGVALQQAEGTVDGPERAIVDVEALITITNTFVAMHIKVDGEDATMTDPLSGNPLPLQTSALPFNLRNLGMTLSGILNGIMDPSFSGDERVDGVAGKVISGTITGAEIKPLIPGAVDDLRQEIEVWVGEDDLPRKVRIAGLLLSNDADGVIRVLSLRNFDTARIP